MKKWLLLVLGVLLLATPILAAPTSGYDLSWRVMAAGGRSMNSTDFALTGTIGQPLTLIGGGASPNAGYCGGFWCFAIQGTYHIFLPLLIR